MTTSELDQNEKKRSFLELKMEPTNQSELRKAAEKNVLTYLAALGYDQKPKQLLMERGLTLVPLPPVEINESDPAAGSVCINVDFNNEDTNTLNANFLTPLSGNKTGVHTRQGI